MVGLKSSLDVSRIVNSENESEEDGGEAQEEEEDIDIEQAVDQAFGLKQGITRTKEDQTKNKLSLVLGKAKNYTLLKKKRKLISYIRKFKREQSHIYMTNGLLIYDNMTKYLRISLYIRKPFLIYDVAPDRF